MSQPFGTNKAYNMAYKLTNNIMVKTEIPKEKEKDVIRLSDY